MHILIMRAKVEAEAGFNRLMADRNVAHLREADRRLYVHAFMEQVYDDEARLQAKLTKGLRQGKAS